MDRYTCDTGWKHSMVTEDDGPYVLYTDHLAAIQELRGALEELIDYTEACEGVMNACPAGQVLVARTILTKYTKAQ